MNKIKGQIIGELRQNDDNDDGGGGEAMNISKDWWRLGLRGIGEIVLTRWEYVRPTEKKPRKKSNIFSG